MKWPRMDADKRGCRRLILPLLTLRDGDGRRGGTVGQQMRDFGSAGGEMALEDQLEE